MISRCPSCGAPAPDEIRQCRACGWDFVTNKKSEIKAEPPKKTEPIAEKPKSAPAPSGGLSLPPARGGSAEVPATGLGMARLPKVETGGTSTPGAPDANPFALPVARNLGPKPGESLFAPPPVAVEAKLPAAKPKAAEEPKPEEPVEEKPPQEKPPLKGLPKKAAPLDVPEPKAEAPAPIDPPKAKPAPVEPKSEVEEENEDDSSSALFLPSSTKEIVVETAPKRAKSDAPKSPVEGREPAVTAIKKASTGRPSAVYVAAFAGGALGLLSISAIFMMLRTDPQGSARPTGSSPFGKRSSGDATMTPVLDEPAPAAPESLAPHAPVFSPPTGSGEAPPPTSIPAPAVSRAIEPPKPGGIDTLPSDAPKAVATPTPVPAPVAPKLAVPELVTPPQPVPARPTATFAQTARPKPVPVPVPSVNKPKAAGAKKPTGPQWIFEGTIYDLLTTRGVYGARLVFIDAEDSEVASAEAGEGGHYHVSMKAGPAEGYAMRVMHDDYTSKHIDELDSTSSVRKADLEQRKFLMQAGSRSLPWIGTVGKPVRRDMALVPKISPE